MDLAKFSWNFIVLNSRFVAVICISQSRFPASLRKSRSPNLFVCFYKCVDILKSERLVLALNYKWVGGARSRQRFYKLLQFLIWRYSIDTVHTIFIITDVDIHPHVMSGASSTWGVIQGRLLSIGGSWNTTKISWEFGDRKTHLTLRNRLLGMLQKHVKKQEGCKINNTNLEQSFSFCSKRVKHTLETQNFQISLAILLSKPI